MKVGFTGTRKGLSSIQLTQLVKLIRELDTTELHHGDCFGADVDAHQVASMLGIKRIIHPPSDPKLRAFCNSGIILPEKPYIERNHDIVDATEVLIAGPEVQVESIRSGTWATVRYARSLSKKIYILGSDELLRHFPPNI